MISIIIIVKNDREIEKTLISLDKVRKPRKTEIIVIDASKKETLLDIKNKFPQVRWFYHKNNLNKKITIPEQRNMGLKNSKGDIIVFIDSGCIIGKNWLVDLTKPLLNKTENFVLGLVKPLGTKHHNLDRKNKYLDGCGTANTAFNKKILLYSGIFDETFDYGSDMEFSWRVIKAGYRIRYLPSAIMYHNWGNLKQDIKRAIRYGEARVNLYKKHKDKINYLLTYNQDLFSIYSVLFFLYILLFIPITIIFYWYPLFLLIPFIKNIKVNPLRKMIFDFFWGYGFLKRLFEVIILRK